MLSLGDLLGGDDESDLSSVDHGAKKVEPVKAAPAATPAPVPALSSSAAARNEETKARMERLRQMQKERQEKEKQTYSALKDLGVTVERRTPSPEASARQNVSMKGKTPNILDFSDSDSETLGGSKKPPKPAPAAEAAKPARDRAAKERIERPARGKGRSRRDGASSEDSYGTEDSLEEWGVMMADRGTQTTLGTTIETQTDPPARVVNCRECYKKHFGRDVAPEDLVVPCEHTLVDLLPRRGGTAEAGVGTGGFGPHGDLATASGFHADPAVRDYLADLSASTKQLSGAGLGRQDAGAFPSSTAHWKLQLSKIHYMLDRTLTSLAPDLELAQEVLGAKGAQPAAPAAAPAQAPPAPPPRDPRDDVIHSLQEQLADLKTALQQQQQQQPALHPPSAATPALEAPPAAVTAPLPEAPLPTAAPAPAAYSPYAYPIPYGYQYAGYYPPGAYHAPPMYPPYAGDAHALHAPTQWAEGAYAQHQPPG
eukprot:TRINITY_DN2852_c1_g1_i1.p1 TRINITY_DN2852_c1_g1~~TRINITY_DN2852_c1_g1_i1.p1  ORF type:complete len:483 (+),score=127.95 TRINITY_DN2852_c1_g1_i1:55-1503(+)